VNLFTGRRRASGIVLLATLERQLSAPAVVKAFTVKYHVPEVRLCMAQLDIPTFVMSMVWVIESVLVSKQMRYPARFVTAHRRCSWWAGST